MLKRRKCEAETTLSLIETVRCVQCLGNKGARSGKVSVPQPEHGATPLGDMMLDRDGDLIFQLLLYLSLVLIVASLMGLSAAGIAAWSSE